MSETTTGDHHPGAARRPDPGPAGVGRSGPSRRLVQGVAVAAALVLLAGLVTAGVLWQRHRDARDQAESVAEATTVAQQFALRVDAVDGSKPDDYVKSIAQLLTTKYRAEFTKQFEPFKQVYAEGKAKGEGKIIESAVGTSDADSASILVVHDATFQSSVNKSVRHHRWTVDLRKVEDKWLVDDFNQVS